MESTPRVLGQDLPRAVGTTVRLVAKCESSHGTTAKVVAADNVPVNIVLVPGSNLTSPTVYEIIGRVQPDGSIQEMTSTLFGDQFDLSLYCDFVQLVRQVPEIF